MKLSFVQKLWLPLILSLLCLAGISIYQAYLTKETRLDERKADLTHATELALSVVKTFGDQVAAGSIPVAEAQKRAMDSIRNMRYGEGGYFAIFNSNGTILMNPIRPELNGKDARDYKDSNGIYYIRETVAVSKRDGSGFTAFSQNADNASQANRSAIPQPRRGRWRALRYKISCNATVQW